MSKKPSSAAKQLGKSAPLSLKRAKAEEQQLAQNVEGLQVDAQPEVSPATVKSVSQPVEVQAEARQEQQSKHEAAAQESDNVARAETILTAVQDNDHGGTSLLVEAAAAAPKEEKDDKAAAWVWSDTLPWLAALGGVAALASIRTSSSDPAPTGASGASGVVFDTPVTNAIVFRDANGNGKWDAGEAIAVTDSQGRFSNLGGSGNIVATSLDRLVARINNQDVTYSASDYAAFNAASGLRLTSGVAIDVGTDLSLGTADDFVWSGTYTNTTSQSQGALTVYVTAVSSLVTAYLAGQGITAPTQAQIDTAVTQLKGIFAYDDSTGIRGEGANVQFYTSDLNGQVTKIMGEAIAKAQAAGTDVQQAIADALGTLAQAAADAYDAEATLDLTSSGDLESIFGLTAAEAEALAQQTSNAGPAVYSIWYTEDGSRMIDADATDSNGVDTIQNDGPIGNITVLTQGEGSSADLTVEPTDESDALSLQQAHVLVQSAGDGSAANLTLSSATGTITEVIVRADGDVGAVGGPTWRTFIEDGGADQYDDGNYIGTWTKAEYDLAVSLDTVSTDIYPTSVAYSGTVADGNFGTGSQNVAVYRDSIFGMLVTGNTSDTFSITGKTGQDLQPASVEDTLTFAEYNGYQAIVIRSFGEEPSMNRVFIYKADENVTLAPFDGVADSEDYFISGLSGVDQFGYFVVYGSSDVEAIASDELEAFFHAAVDDVLSAASAADMSTAFYDSDVQTALRGSMALYAEFTNYEYSVDGAFTLLSSDVSVSADSTANADIDFNGDVQGNLSVVAAGDSADASLTLHSTSGEVNLQGGDIDVTASGVSADARATIGNAGGNVGNVSVTASALSADASLNLGLTGTVDGNISVRAEGEDSSASASLNGVSGDDHVTLSGGNISASATGAGASADLHVHDANGNVASLDVSATGNNADAYVHLSNAGGSADLLTVANINVSANTSGNCGDVSAQASLDLDGNMAVTGDITVTAAGSADSAYISGDTSHLTLGVAATSDDAAIGSSISVTASGDSSEAGAEFTNATGDVGKLSATASGSHSTANLTISNSGSDGELVLHGVPGSVTTVVPGSVFFQTDALDAEQGLAYTGYTDSSSDESPSVDALDPTFSGTSTNVDYTWGSGDILNSGASDDVQVHWTGFIRWPGATGETTSVNFYDSSDDGFILKLNGNSVIDNWQDQGDATYNGQGSFEAVAGDLVQVDIWYYENGGGAVAQLYWDQPTPPVALDVTASSADASATATISADVHIEAAIVVEASGACADATADINTSGSTHTVLGLESSNISVTASGYSTEANAYIHNASGSVGALSVTSSAEQGDASLTLLTEGDGVTVGSLTMLSTADGWASADIHGNVEFTGNISVTASGDGATASADINNYTDDVAATTLGGGDITLLASGDNANASADIRHAGGTVGALNVTASGNGSNTDALLTLETEGDGVTAETLTVTASGTNADASADISGDMAITGDINVSATASGATASADINVEGSGATVLGVAATLEDVAIGSNITVSADVATATAVLNIGNASGTVESLDVTANDGTATLDIGVADESTLTINTVAVTSNGTGTASAALYGDAGSTVAVEGNITVTADGAVDPAHLYINSESAGSTRLGAEGVSNDISVSASAGATADAYIANASGTADELIVTAAGSASEAYLSLGTEGDGVTAASLTVTASGTNAGASADISGDMAITGDINVTATAAGANASADINIEGSGATALGVAATSDDVAIGSNITVSADVATATAALNIGNASGTVESLDVTANDGTATLDIGVADESTLTINTVAVTSNGTGHASADVYGGVDSTVAITGNVTVTANGAVDPAYLYVNGTDINGGTVLGTDEETASNDITVNASNGAEAYAFLNNASGQSDQLTINAQGGNADAGLDVGVASGDELAVASLSVTADGGNDSADAYLWNHGASSELTITGNIEVAAGGSGAYAYAEINQFDWERDGNGEWAGGDAQGHVILGVAGVPEVITSETTSHTATVAGRQVTTTTTVTTVTPAIAGSAGDLTVTASGDSAVASADIRTASGSVDEISVTASGADASADLTLQTESYDGIDGVTAASLTVTASDDSADAGADILGDVTITGAVSVTASGTSSDATIDINTSGSAHTVLGVSAVPEQLLSSTQISGDIVTTVTVVKAATAASAADLTVEASASSADASADIHNASGVVANISVTAGGTDASAYLTLQTESHDGVDGVTAASLTVTASGDAGDAISADAGADAHADILGNVTITGAINVTASGNCADATVHVNDNHAGSTVLGLDGVGSDLTITASAYRASADADIRNVSGAVEDILVQATVASADASLYLEVASGEELDVASLMVSSDINPTDASADASVIIRGNVSIAGDITVTGGDGSSLDINSSGDGQTTLGGGNLTIESYGADSDADAYIHNASGVVGDINVTAESISEDGEYADAYLDLRVAEDKELEIGTITVHAEGSADAQADINGNLSITGDIVIQASGEYAHADAEINNAGFDASRDVVVPGETHLNGGHISVDAHNGAEAIGWIHNASGSVGNVTVSASGSASNAALDLSALQPGQHQVQKITLSEQTLSALGDGDTVGIWINGNWFEHTMGQCAYMSNAEKLAEIVQAFRDNGGYDYLGADIYQEGNTFVIRWNDYGSHPDPRGLEINGQWTGFSQSVNAAAPSLAFNSSDVTVEALFGENTTANLAVDGTTGTLNDVRVGAVIAQNNSASASIGFNGNLSGDVVVDAIGDGNDATLDLHADPSGRITLGDFGCNDVHIGAWGLDAQAAASLTGLDGQIDYLDIRADVKNAEASANLQFAHGSVNYACMDAIDHQSTVRLTVEQGEQNGYVNVAGQGHAAVTYYVDADNNTADEINLWAMHGSPLSGDTDSNDWWGYADIDLVAKYNDVLHQPGTGLQTNCNDTLWNNRMEVNDFNVQRDSINVILQDDADGDEGTQNHLVRHEIAFMHSGDLTVAEGTEFDNAIDDLLYDARVYFDHLYSGAAGQGYYYREITVDPAVGPNYVRSFLVYDYELGTPTFGSGDASGLIELGGTTGLGWRNVADRYDIESQVQTGGYLDESHDLVGVHAIDNLTVGAYDNGENYQSYLTSHDADSMVSDITVEALNPGDHGYNDSTRASLDISSMAADGCGDSYFELRQSDINVLAQGDDGSNAYANAKLSLRDAWGTLNSITVEANENADATAELKYLSYWSDYDNLGSVKVHDVDVRAMGYNGDARLSTESSDLTFDHSVVNVTVGYDAQGWGTYAYSSTASLDVNRWDNVGYVDGVISQLNVAARGDNNCADVEFNYYTGDIDSLRVTADGWYSSADADVQFSNDSVINAVQSIYVDASGHGTDARAYIHATDSLKDIQITGGDIYVGAYSQDANAGLDMDEVQVTGQVNQLVVEASRSADAWASISGNGLSVIHERDGDSSNDWTDSSIRVSASDNSVAHLAISGYGQYLDSVILNANDSSDTYLSLDMRGFIDTLDIQVNGYDSYVSADITQQTYGGVVNISASENDYLYDGGSIYNVVDLAYRTATAKEINIDNSGRSYDLGSYDWTGGLHFVGGSVDDTLSLNLLIAVADEDIVYTNHAALLDYHSVAISGWTDNDSISFNGEAGVVASNYEEDPTDWSYLNTGAHPDRGIARLFQEADAALDGTVDYYFGVCDGNGYLFHDEDGVGITTVVELIGVTAFDYHQINGNTPT